MNLLAWIKDNATTPEQVQLKKELERGVGYKQARIAMEEHNYKPVPAQVLTVPEPMPQLPKNGWDSLKDLSGATVSLQGHLAENAGVCTLLLVSEKRIFARRLIESWRKELKEVLHEEATEAETAEGKERAPGVVLQELVLNEQWIERLAAPIHNYVFKRDLGFDKERYGSIWIYGGPCKKFKEEIHATNPYLPYAYLIGPDSLTYWISSGMCSKGDVRQLLNVSRAIVQASSSRAAGRRGKGRR